MKFNEHIKDAILTNTNYLAPKNSLLTPHKIFWHHLWLHSAKSTPLPGVLELRSGQLVVSVYKVFINAIIEFSCVQYVTTCIFACNSRALYACITGATECDC